MSPFNTAVFRIRLLLLALALGMMGFGEDKKTGQIAQGGAKPMKAVKAPQRKPQPTGKIVAVQQHHTPAVIGGHPEEVRLR